MGRDPSDTFPPTGNSATLSEKVDRLLKIVDGDRNLDIPGLRQRMADVEKVAIEYRGIKLMLRGALIFMGISTVTSVGALYTLAKNLGLIP